jgi:hypothetical protein
MRLVQLSRQRTVKVAPLLLQRVEILLVPGKELHPRVEMQLVPGKELQQRVEMQLVPEKELQQRVEMLLVPGKELQQRVEKPPTGTAVPTAQREVTQPERFVFTFPVHYFRFAELLNRTQGKAR